MWCSEWLDPSKCVPLWCQIGINGMAAQDCFELLNDRIHLRHPGNTYILPIIFFIWSLTLFKKKEHSRQSFENCGIQFNLIIFVQRLLQ